MSGNDRGVIFPKRHPGERWVGTHGVRPRITNFARSRSMWISDYHLFPPHHPLAVLFWFWDARRASLRSDPIYFYFSVAPPNIDWGHHRQHSWGHVRK